MSGAKSNPGPAALRRPLKRRGPVALNCDANSLVTDAFAARGFSNPQLVLRWREFAGPALGRLTAPISLSAQGQLTISADPSVSLFLQHQTPQLIQRINIAIGSHAVTKIKVTSGKFLKPVAAPIRRTLSAAEKAKIEATLAGLDDGALRQALATFGTNLVSAAKAKPSN